MTVWHVFVVFVYIIGLETHGSVSYIPNLFGDERILVAGGGRYNLSSNKVEEQNKNLVSFQIERREDSSKPLDFTKESHHQWTKNLAPYVQAIEDRIVFAQGGVVRLQIYINKRKKLYFTWQYSINRILM